MNPRITCNDCGRIVKAKSGLVVRSFRYFRQLPQDTQKCRKGHAAILCVECVNASAPGLLMQERVVETLGPMK